MQSKLIGIGIVKIYNANSCLRNLCITVQIHNSETWVFPRKGTELIAINQ